jgi:hypothetical protein
MQTRHRILGTWELIEGKLLNDGVASDYEFRRKEAAAES